MDAAPLRTLLDAFAGDRHTFLYSGQFLDAHTARLITLGEASVGPDEERRSARTRLAFVLVEAYQNIIRHGSRTYNASVKDPGRSMLLLRNWDKCNAVSTVNAVPRSEANALIKALADLDALDNRQLKSRYLETLQQEKRTRRGGAGLGLIEMARRSGNALRHDLSDLDEQYLLFNLSITLNEQGVEGQDMNTLERYHRCAVEASLVLLCCGLGSPEIRTSLFRILEQEMAHDPASVARMAKTGHAGLALLSAMGSATGAQALGLLHDEQGIALVFSGVVTEENALQLSASIGGNYSHETRSAHALAEALKSLRNSAGGTLEAFESSPVQSKARVLFTARLHC